MRVATRAVLPMLLVAAACTGSGDAGGESTTTTTLPPNPSIPTTTPSTMVVPAPIPEDPVVVWVSDAVLGDAIETRAVDYLAATGIAVEVEVFDGEAPPAPDLLTAVLQDALPRSPDIYIGPHTWLLRLAEAGLLEPVMLDENLPETIAEAVSLRGYPLAVPLAVDAVVQVRNPGLMPSAPSSIEDLPCPSSGVCLLLPGNGDPDVHYPFLVSLGGYVYPADGINGYDLSDLGVGSDPSIAGGSILQQLAVAGVARSEADADAVGARFAEGDVALAWVLTGQLSAVDEGPVDPVVEPLPDFRGNPPIAVAEVTAAFVNPNGHAKSAATEFAVQWLGDVNGSARVASALSLTPVWREAATEAMGVVLDAVETGDPAPYTANFEVVWAQLARAFSRMLGGVTAATALGDAAAAIASAG